MKSSNRKGKSPSSRIGRLAALVRLLGIRGRGARPHGPFVAISLVLTSIILPCAPTAFAAQTRPYQGSFGAFTTPESLAVDQGSGDVYVLDVGAGTVSRFDPEGNPVPFSASETYVSGNELTGTPGGAFVLGFPFPGDSENQIAVAPPGSPAGTAGDLYVAEPDVGVLDIFAPTGEYLGRLDGSGNTNPKTGGRLCGVATDPTGGLYLGYSSPGHSDKYVPSTDPPLNADFDSEITGVGGFVGPCNLAASATTLYVSSRLNEPLAAYPLSSFPGGGREVSAESSRTVVEEGGESIESTTVAVDPAGGALFVDEGDRIAEFDGSQRLLGHFGAGQLTESGGLAYDYPARVAFASSRESGQVAIYGPPVTLPEAVTGDATEPTGGAATLNGTVDPEGEPLTECVFEYGESKSYGASAPCEEPDAAEIGAGSGAVPVHARLTGLQASRYHFRIVASNVGGSTSGEDKTVAITGPPRIIEESATPFYIGARLEAIINPANSATTWRFEYGPTSAYGISTAPQTIPAGGEPVKISAHVDGLAESTAYHFRVVAVNSVEPVDGADRSFITIERPGNAGCPNERIREESPLDPITEVPYATQLPECRAAEVVSGGEKGPLTAVGETTNASSAQIRFQVAPSGASVAFMIAPGLPGTSSGGEVIYGADRAETGWTSEQLTPPALDTVNNNGTANVPSVYLYEAPDLRCGIVASPSSLTSDTPAQSVEEGIDNLYRREADGSLTLITDLVPTNPTAALTDPAGGFYIAGASADCSRIYFQTTYQYPGVGIGARDPGGKELRELYEWDEGASPRLRRVGAVPTETGEVEVPAEAGNRDPSSTPGNQVGAVSEDGSLVFFTADRLSSPNPAEVGKEAVFLRTADGRSVDVSQSETATPDLGAEYQIADSFGTRVFFLANYGLTADSSSGGPEPEGSACGRGSGGRVPCDLYEYDFARPEGERLVDLSADHNAADAEGAAAAGVLGVSDDGTNVYFATSGQLVPGDGETYLDNLADSTYNVYLSADVSGGVPDISYVGSIGARESKNMLVSLSTVAAVPANELLSRVTPSGSHLLFESSLPFDGYESDGAREAYLFSAATGEARCISCRRDGREPLGVGPEDRPLGTGLSPNNRPNLSLTLSPDGRRVFFESLDPLAPAAVPGKVNIYEWQEGTVHTLVTGEPAVPESGFSPGVRFVGASESGSDVFVVSPERLAPQDKDSRPDLYDLRIDGGFPAQAEPPSPCVTLQEGACQRASRAAPPTVSPVTSGFAGPGNPPSAHHKKKHHKKKHHKKKHHKKKHHKKKHHKKKHHKKKGKTSDKSGGHK